MWKVFPMVQLPTTILYALLDFNVLPWGPTWAHVIDIWVLVLPTNLLFITYAPSRCRGSRCS